MFLYISLSLPPGASSHERETVGHRRVVWADNAKGPTSLRVENYAHGSDAALDLWVVRERKEGGAGGAE